MQRFGSVIVLRDEKFEEYRALHAAVWPEVRAMIRECHLQNYSIYVRRMPDGQRYLFSYFEYTGDKYEADMARMAADPVTQKWWALCKPCQLPLADRAGGEWWAEMDEVFHSD